MLTAAVEEMAATASMDRVATGEMAETVLPVAVAMEAMVVTANWAKAGTAAMVATVPLEAVEVAPVVKGLAEMGAMEIMETRNNGASKT